MVDWGHLEDFADVVAELADDCAREALHALTRRVFLPLETLVLFLQLDHFLFR